MVRTDVSADALVLHVVSMRDGWNLYGMRTLTRLFAAGAGILRARAANQGFLEG
jgi:hypothetical protein